VYVLQKIDVQNIMGKEKAIEFLPIENWRTYHVMFPQCFILALVKKKHGHGSSVVKDLLPPKRFAKLC